MFTCQRQGGVCFETMTPMSESAVAERPAMSARFGDGPGGVVRIDAPVGDGWLAKNSPSDVAIIQKALSNLLPEDRGGIVISSVDGVCGQKTKNSIYNFQKKHFGLNGADRLIEPGKRTILKLNEVLQAKSFSAASLDDYCRFLGLPTQAVTATLGASFQLARQWIAAGFNRTLNPNLDPLVEKYFQISRQGNPVTARGQVASVIGLLHRFFNHAGELWGEAAFVPEPIIQAGPSTYAWTTAGGYFQGGEVGYVPAGSPERLVPIRFDAIYYTTRFILFMNTQQRAFSIVHELCHFVSNNPRIVDFAYAHKQPADFANMAPARRLQNTDHYAMLCYEAGTGLTDSPVSI
jgi:hypothetical protein